MSSSYSICHWWPIVWFGHYLLDPIWSSFLGVSLMYACGLDHRARGWCDRIFIRVKKIPPQYKFLLENMLSNMDWIYLEYIYLLMFMLTCSRNSIPLLLGTLHLPFSTFLFFTRGFKFKYEGVQQKCHRFF
jgi:membrane protein DedA with SNARE-associated domain